MAKSVGRIAKRYSRALFELCKPDELEGRRDALSQLVQIAQEHKQLREAMANPAVSPSARAAVAKDVAQLVRPGDAVFANFLATMLVNGRLSALEATLASFSQMIAEFMKALGLKITTAFPLSEAERQRLETDVRNQVPKEYASLVSMEWAENSDLLGGMVIQAGDSVLDGSLSGSLERVARGVAS